MRTFDIEWAKQVLAKTGTSPEYRITRIKDLRDASTEFGRRELRRFPVSDLPKRYNDPVYNALKFSPWITFAVVVAGETGGYIGWNWATLTAPLWVTAVLTGIALIGRTKRGGRRV